MLDNMVDEDEAAAALGQKKETLTVWRTRGRGPAYHKIGRRILYSREDLQSYLEGCRVVPNAPRGGE